MSNPESESRISLKKRKIRTVFSSINKKLKDVYGNNVVYIQMRLPVDKITKEFEENLENEIKRKLGERQIRIATKNDLKSIKKIYDQAWQSTNMPFRTISESTLEKIFNYKDTKFMIASVNSIDVGFILLDFEGYDKEYGVIAGLGIIPDYQHKRIGTSLGVASWNFFKEKDIKELRCEVYEENKSSYKFIKGLGFEEFDKRGYDKREFQIYSSKMSF